MKRLDSTVVAVTVVIVAVVKFASEPLIVVAEVMLPVVSKVVKSPLEPLKLVLLIVAITELVPFN